MAAPEALELFAVPLNGLRPGDLADNFLEVAMRFLSPEHLTRKLKDAISQEIPARLGQKGMSIASATPEFAAPPTLPVASTMA